MNDNVSVMEAPKTLHIVERFSVDGTMAPPIPLNDMRPDPEEPGQIMGLYLKYRCSRCGVVIRKYGSDPRLYIGDKFFEPKDAFCNV